jgi:membrane protease YdiL (CAAX protease family)
MLSLVLAAALWVLVFLVRPFDFWLMLAFSTFILLIVSALLSHKRLALRASVALVLYGVVSAILLYGLFLLGYDATKSSPIFSQGVNQVYALRSSEPNWLIALLLIFPIGLGEEFYWRGLIQRIFTEKAGSYRGLGLASVAYALVHLPTLNPPLILTALIGGLVWGSLYKFTKSLVPGIVSHILWDLMIFVILPLT